MKVAFADGDPSRAKRVAERLASLLIQENLESRNVTAGTVVDFLDEQLTALRTRLTSADAAVRRSQAENGRTADTADVLELEALKQTYSVLAQRRDQATLALSLERRMLGEQLRVIEPARLPTQPVSPNRVALNTAGAIGGLGLGAAPVTLRTRRRPDGVRS